jgi:hypothetical protein
MKLLISNGMFRFVHIFYDIFKCAMKLEQLWAVFYNFIASDVDINLLPWKLVNLILLDNMGHL